MWGVRLVSWRCCIGKLEESCEVSSDESLTSAYVRGLLVSGASDSVSVADETKLELMSSPTEDLLFGILASWWWFSGIKCVCMCTGLAICEGNVNALEE